MSQEQYLTDPEIAAETIMRAAQLGDLKGTIIDFGAGTGMLGLGTWLMGASKVVFVEKDPEAMQICKENAKRLKSEISGEGKIEFCENDVKQYSGKGDVVMQNPPFGTRKEGADKEFLLKAFSTAPIIYSFHKTSTSQYVERLAEENGYCTTHKWDYEFPLKNQYTHHTRRIHRIKVSCWRFQQTFKRTGTTDTA